MEHTHVSNIEGVNEGRSEFIMKTYLHLVGAIGLFVLIESYIFQSGLAPIIASKLTGVSWLVVLGLFMVVSYGASHVAHNLQSKAAQYGALGVFVLAQAIIFVPLLFMAERFAEGTIESAAIMTLTAFACLTVVVFFTRQDFSFLRSFLMWGGLVAIGLIVASVLMGGVELGYWFSAAMVVYAGAAILYDTSNVLHHFRPGQHVSAALQLFSSVALMMWYVVQLFMSGD
ncbi:MAG: Bax inhibitor-1 family protein [Pseudomonadota bacterium]